MMLNFQACPDVDGTESTGECGAENLINFFSSPAPDEDESF